jgi:hypothetical protein
MAMALDDGLSTSGIFLMRGQKIPLENKGTCPPK